MFEIIGIIASVISLVAVFLSYYHVRKTLNSTKYKVELLSSYYKSLFKNDLPVYELTEINRELIKTLDNYVHIIQKLHPKTPLSASLNVLMNTHDNKFYAVTIARDSKSSKTREVFKYEYPVELNTAYMTLLNDHEDYFFSNRLDKPSDSIYNNSTNDHWQLPYKFTLVLPIKERDDKGLLSISGFFCVDSKEPIERGTEIFDDIFNIAVSNSTLLGSIIEAIKDKTMNITVA